MNGIPGALQDLLSDEKKAFAYLITTEGADTHAFKYRGVGKYPNRKPDEQPVTYKIQPVKINTH